MADNKPMAMKPHAAVKKITVKMPADLKATLPAHILGDGYNMREKSKWVVEAVEALLKRPSWEGALLSEVLSTTNAQDVFSMPSELVTKMAKEAARVNIKSPSLNANQSTIIRAAINRRLLGFMGV